MTDKIEEPICPNGCNKPFIEAGDNYAECTECSYMEKLTFKQR